MSVIKGEKNNRKQKISIKKVLESMIKKQKISLDVNRFDFFFKNNAKVVGK